MKKAKRKKTLKRIIKILTISFTFFVLVFTVFSLAVNKNYEKGIFGRKLFIVLSDSMKPEFKAGDVVITKIVDVDELVVGDIITFIEPRGSVVTHKIHQIDAIDSVKYFTTKGLNEVLDDEKIIESRVIGKYSFAIPEIGNLVMFIKTPPGFITFIFIPLFILFLLHLIDFIKVIKYKKRSKKEKIEKEKLRIANMQLELNALKRKLKLSGDKGDA